MKTKSIEHRLRKELEAKRVDYYAASREQIKVYKAAYRAANIHKFKARNTVETAHRVEIKAYEYAYRLACREERKAYRAIRHARGAAKKAAVDRWLHALSDSAMAQVDFPVKVQLPAILHAPQNRT